MAIEAQESECHIAGELFVERVLEGTVILTSGTYVLRDLLGTKIPTRDSRF